MNVGLLPASALNSNIVDWRRRGNHLNGHEPLGQASHVMLSHPTLDQVRAQIVIAGNLRDHSTRLHTKLDDASLELGRKPTLLYSGQLGHHRSGSWGCISFHTRHYRASLHRQQDGFTSRLRFS